LCIIEYINGKKFLKKKVLYSPEMHKSFFGLRFFKIGFGKRVDSFTNGRLCKTQLNRVLVKRTSL